VSLPPIKCADQIKPSSDYEVRVSESRGLHAEKMNYHVYIGRGSSYDRLLVISFFSGRPPFYKRYIELFSIKPLIIFGETRYVFLGSLEEENFIKCLSSILGPGESIFVEYMYDAETLKTLELDTPPHLTRLGYILFMNGFTWFKNWYFPEGFREGLPKLQAEKPLNEWIANKHLEEICRSAIDYMSVAKRFLGDSNYRWMMSRVLMRTSDLLSRYCRNR